MPNIQAIAAYVAAYRDVVPYGNSDAQTIHFTGGNEAAHVGLTARRIRQLLLNMDAALDAIQEAEFRAAETQVDLDEIEHKLDALAREIDFGPQMEFQRRRLEICRDRKLAGQAKAEKLLAEKQRELELMHAELVALPRVESREAFEAQESGYWRHRLFGVAMAEVAASGRPGVGTLQALRELGCDLVAGQRGEISLVERVTVPALEATHGR